jgi:hypothetical protein
MIKLYDNISPERQEFLLNPKNKDRAETFLYHTYGRRLYKISVGYKWVMLRSECHVQRMRHETFKQLALSNWIRDAKTDASIQVYNKIGKYKRPRNWRINYGL